MGLRPGVRDISIYDTSSKGKNKFEVNLYLISLIGIFSLGTMDTNKTGSLNLVYNQPNRLSPRNDTNLCLV